MRVVWGKKVDVVRKRHESESKEAGALAAEVEYQGAVAVWCAAKKWAKLAEKAFKLASEPAGAPRGGWETARARRWKAYGDHAEMIESKWAQESARREVLNARAKMKRNQ